MTHAVPPPDHREEPEHHGDDPRAQARTEPVRVLVVDDEPAIRHALLELLRGEGYDVQSAADGFKALGRVEQWVPDVVISDGNMPALGGMELSSLKVSVMSLGVFIQVSLLKCVKCVMWVKWVKSL